MCHCTSCAATAQEGLAEAVEAYRTFDAHETDWVRVTVDPSAA